MDGAKHEEKNIQSVDEILNKPEMEKFKKKYESVFDQIKDRAHLARGYVTFEFTLEGLGSVTLRSLTRKERDLIAIKTPFSDKHDPEKREELDSLRRTLHILFSLMEFSAIGLTGEEYQLKAPTVDGFPTWIKLPNVAAKLEIIENFSDFVEEVIFEFIAELRYATRLALADQIKNL